jgi:hypothetical protein
MRIVLTLIFVVISSLAFGQNKVLFHEYSPTASSWDILEWNLPDTTGKVWVLKETVDKEDRVIELEFLKDGKLIPDPLCYLANRVTFKYEDGKIIETLFSGQKHLLATDCEMPYKTIYHLDKDNKIEKMETFAEFDYAAVDSATIEQLKEWVPEHKIIEAKEGQLQVDYFYHSFAKMNGIYPVSNGYELIEDYYYGDEPEKSSIKEGLKRK